jgi:hypothetical protein
LTDLKAIPEDLENYVLKPLFSFSGTRYCVVEKNFTFFKKKANYIPIVQSPDGKSRSPYVWKRDSALLYV